MFNWKPNDSELKTQIKDIQNQLNDFEIKMERDRSDLWVAINDTQKELSKHKSPHDLTALESRMAVFDTWRAQLHTLLIERGNSNQEKLTRTGNALSRFYGRK